MEDILWYDRFSAKTVPTTMDETDLWKSKENRELHEKHVVCKYHVLIYFYLTTYSKVVLKSKFD